jgi:hypothetical protein
MRTEFVKVENGASPPPVGLTFSGDPSTGYAMLRGEKVRVVGGVMVTPLHCDCPLCRTGQTCDYATSRDA